jgi:polygalacturonase
MDFFPDGTAIPEWFSDTAELKPVDPGRQFLITDYGVINDSTVLQTSAIQKTIDEASLNGGGIIVIPRGTFLCGALFFRKKTGLFVSEGATLKGSDNIEDYPLIPSRIEGQSIEYFAALVNAYGVNGFTISGKGTIDGNGLKYWEAFWKRREENPQCTNLEVFRPRLIFIWNCNDVRMQDVKLRNAGYWTSHFYKCSDIKIINVNFYSPYQPVKAPSTDAIDIDVCTNVLIKDCYMAVNDDAIALKGGKGPWADTDTCNGENRNILIEDCRFGFCHSALTCGSESIKNRNVLMRNCYVNKTMRLLWLKMRPDTPQEYEFIKIENINGQVTSLIFIKPWTQFFDLKGRKDIPLSKSENITFKNIDLKCDVFFDVEISEHDRLSHFKFENLKIETANASFDKNLIQDVILKNVKVNNILIK